MLAILDVDVPRGMLLVYEEHPDDDPVEATNLRHAVVFSSAPLSPNASLSRRERSERSDWRPSLGD